MSKLSLQEKANYAFNKVFYDFIKEVKPFIKSSLKAYKIVDLSDKHHFELFCGQYVPFKTTFLEKLVEDIFHNEDVQKMQIFQNVTLSMLLQNCPENTHKTIKKYVYTLGTISLVKENECEKLLELVLNALKNISISEEYNEIMSNILDDDIQNMLNKVKSLYEDVDMSFLESSTFGKLAKDIASDIDFSQITSQLNQGQENPDGLAQMMSNLDLGSIFGKIGPKIIDRITSGEINPNDILKEASKCSEHFNNPFIKDMLNNVELPSDSPTKDRLRKKLADKNIQ